MKEIKAYIKKHKLDAVVRALRKIEGLTGLSMIEAGGYGLGWAAADGPREVELRPGIKLEIVCRDDLVEPVLAAIEKAARTGLKGDGKIYVADLEQAVRISSGERGSGAL